MAMANRVTLAMSTVLNELLADAKARGEKHPQSHVILGLCLTMKAVLFQLAARNPVPMPPDLAALSAAVDQCIGSTGVDTYMVVKPPETGSTN